LCNAALLERFPAKWMPVRGKKTRQKKAGSAQSEKPGPRCRHHGETSPKFGFKFSAKAVVKISVKF
jgi:hypothetical protein